MKKIILNILICTAVAANIMICSACGQSYELVLSDRETKAESTAESTESIPLDAGETAPAEDGEKQTGDETTGLPDAENPVSDSICVYVCGAVQKAGVYELPAGSRVYEAIEAAGGLSEDAEPRALNQAQLLGDGQQITVYTREEIDNAGECVTVGNAGTGIGADSSGAGVYAGSGSGSGADGGLVNLNTDGREKLMTLPGIGAARADAIIAYREENGAFTSAEEIMQIEGIGEKSYEKLKDRITV